MNSLGRVSCGVVAFCLWASPATSADDGLELRPYEANPRFWQYQGRPVLLLGGSKDDNLFQLPDLKEHLDEMAAAGANYIRNTMSDRPDVGHEVYPFARLENGKYDLGRWNEEYWQRFANLLRWTAERDIIIQIEVWDRFDYTDVRQPNWQRHPYNPANNVNYSFEESGFLPTYPRHPGSNDQPFFFTVPTLKNNRVVLPYQIAQVDRMLSMSLAYGHVLYCIDNETSGDEEWGKFWADHIRRRAAEAGRTVYVTEMWDQWNPRGEEHRRTLDHPEVYSFVDISQNNHNSGQAHWESFQWVREYIKDAPRPINTVKIYGADTGRYGTSRDGLERFWRNILGGAAATRFHRPDSGLGLSDTARQHIRSARMLLEDFDIFQAEPDAGFTRLSAREANEAYLSFVDGKQYAVYFPDGGRIALDLTRAPGEFRLRWLDIGASRWAADATVTGGAVLPLEAPGEGHWVCLLTRAR